MKNKFRCGCHKPAHKLIDGEPYCKACAAKIEELEKRYSKPVEVFPVEVRKFGDDGKLPEEKPKKRWWQFWK